MRSPVRWLGATLIIATVLGTATAQQTGKDLESLSREVTRLYYAGQPDAAILVGERLLQVAGQTGAPDSQAMADGLMNLAKSYHVKRNVSVAVPLYLRALSIYEKLYKPNTDWRPCAILLDLGKATFSTKELDRSIGYYERALACAELTYGTTNKATIDSLQNLVYAYIYVSSRDDLHAKGELLIRQWLKTLEPTPNANDVDVALLMRRLAQIKKWRNQDDDAHALYVRAFDRLELRRNPQKPEPERLLLEADLLSDLAGPYGGGTDEYFRLQLRRLALLEEIPGQAVAAKVAAQRDYVARLRGDIPERQVAPLAPEPLSAQARSQVLVRPAAAPEPAKNAAGERVRTAEKTWHAPKGYEHLRPATLYTSSDLTTYIWIIAHDRAEAEDLMLNRLTIGTQTSRWYWSNCLGMRNPGTCPAPITELGYGWIATIGTLDPILRAGKTMYFYAYEAPSRQIAIDHALAVYRRERGSQLIQTLRVGLVSEIPWRALLGPSSDFGSREGGEHPSEINYRTACDWTSSRGSEINMNPEVFTGDTSASPACRNEYRQDEKLPVPVLLADPAKR